MTDKINIIKQPIDRSKNCKGCAFCLRGDFVLGSLLGICDKDGSEIFATDACADFTPMPEKKEGN